MKTKFVLDGKVYLRNEEKCRKGGNGIVFFISCKQTDNIYAVKFFNVQKYNLLPEDSSEEIEIKRTKMHERYERFKYEVKFLNENSIDGVIPIIDSYTPKSISFGDEEPYYIMPKGERLKITECTLVASFEICLSLAKTLRIIHQREYAHRDIKPTNILFLNNKPCFCDFGLVWRDNEERLTNFDEQVGPSKIIPPELEHIDPQKKIDFKSSDIYLLSKVLWMMLKKDANGFSGKYDRTRDDIYLDFLEKKEVNCFEPTHELLERSTSEDWRKRIDIYTFIELLERQIEVLTQGKNDIVSSLNIKTINNRMFNGSDFDKISYFNIDKISNYINSISDYAKMEIRLKDKSMEVIPLKSIIINGILHINAQIYAKTIELTVFPKELEIYRTGKAKMLLTHDNSRNRNYDLFNAVSYSDGLFQDVYLDDSFEIEILSKG